jgi:hypothetical protein
MRWNMRGGGDIWFIYELNRALASRMNCHVKTSGKLPNRRIAHVGIFQLPRCFHCIGDQLLKPVLGKIGAARVTYKDVNAFRRLVL